MTYAKVITDSVSPEGHRLTTMEVQFHRFVLAEFNTHRVFSRNSASSRAIPVHKQLDEVRRNPAVPVEWPSERGGMQGGDEPVDEDRAEYEWRYARVHAMRHAKELANLGVHKSVVNRLLEPFMWHTVIVTSTAWENFFRQRVSELAQPEISAAARLMQDVYEQSEPEHVSGGGWHLPYVTPEDHAQLSTSELVRVSVARCARVSYLNHDGTRNVKKDLGLYDRLTTARPMHASPLEHVATPAAWNVVTFQGSDLPKVGNFLGWLQHRTSVEWQRGVNSYE